MTLTFHHIGVLTPSLNLGSEAMNGMMPGLSWTDEMVDENQQVAVRFACDNSGIVYEVISPTSSTSPISRALKGNRELLNHVAYLTDDLQAEVERMRGEGAFPVGKATPGIVYDNAPIQFLLTPLGFLIELIEHDGPNLDFVPA